MYFRPRSSEKLSSSCFRTNISAKNLVLFSVFLVLSPGWEEDQDHRADRRPAAVGHPRRGHQPLHGHLPEDGGRLLRPLPVLLHLRPLSWALVALRLRDSLTHKEPRSPSCCPLLLSHIIKASLSAPSGGGVCCCRHSGDGSLAALYWGSDVLVVFTLKMRSFFFCLFLFCVLGVCANICNICCTYYLFEFSRQPEFKSEESNLFLEQTLEQPLSFSKQTGIFMFHLNTCKAQLFHLLCGKKRNKMMNPASFLDISSLPKHFMFYFSVFNTIFHLQKHCLHIFLNDKCICYLKKRISLN